MEPANSRTQAAQAESVLDAAIKHHESIAAGTPGSWSVEANDGSVMLAWRCEASDEAVANMYGDEPFVVWGGDAILADAGMPDFDDSGCDAFRNRRGDEILSHWVEWKL